MPHKPGKAWTERRKKREAAKYNRSRPRRHEFYQTAEWRKLRAWYIERHPLCEVCEKEGRVTPAEIVHHIQEIADGGDPLDPSNLQSVCRACHNRIHNGQGQGAG